MTFKDLELKIAQVDAAIKVCRSSFRSKKKQKIYSNLIKLFEAIKASSYTSFDITRVINTKIILERIYVGIESLHYRNERETSVHLINCLELALVDWLDDPNFFCIVFSQNNSLTDFQTTTLDEVDISVVNRICKKYFGIEYDHGLIPISHPRFFKEDFLSSVPMYHELGHFIDANYMISKFVVRDPTFMPKFTDREQLTDYIAEHFCDLFASQYLGSIMKRALNYYAYNSPAGSQHPSTDFRISVIETFLTGSGGVDELEIVNRLKAATEFQTKRKKTQRSLTNRLKQLSLDPLQLNKPVLLKDKTEVHHLFVRGWEHFMDSTELKQRYPDPFKRLRHVNSLIKRTIDRTLPNGDSWATKLFDRWLG